MLSAVGVVLLWFGSFVQVADISMAVVASLMAVFAVIEYGKGAPWTVFAVTSVMMLANLFITPYYMGVDRAVVVNLIPKLLLPFNFTKATLNAAITLLIYKPIVTAMRRAGVIKSSGSVKSTKTMLFVTAIAVGVIVVSLVVFFNVLGAEIKWFQPGA